MEFKGRFTEHHGFLPVIHIFNHGWCHWIKTFTKPPDILPAHGIIRHDAHSFWCWMSLVGHTPMPPSMVYLPTFAYIYLHLGPSVIGWFFPWRIWKNISLQRVPLAHLLLLSVRLQRNPRRGASTFWGRSLVQLENGMVWKWWFIVDFPIKMVIFHSYVSLPEGILFLW